MCSPGRRLARIVKLVRHAKSTDAAHGCPTLRKGEEAAIGTTETTIAVRVLGTPSSIIAGQCAGGRLRQHYRHHYEGRHNFAVKAHGRLFLVIEITPRTQNPFHSCWRTCRGSLNQFVLVSARKSRGGEWWSPDDYDVRDSHGKVVGRIMLHPQAPKSPERRLAWRYISR
jgi:hypothetical protein